MDDYKSSPEDLVDSMDELICTFDEMVGPDLDIIIMALLSLFTFGVFVLFISVQVLKSFSVIEKRGRMNQTNNLDRIIPWLSAVFCNLWNDYIFLNDETMRNSNINNKILIDDFPAMVAPPLCVGSNFEAVQWTNQCLKLIYNDELSFGRKLTKIWLDTLSQFATLKAQEVVSADLKASFLFRLWVIDTSISGLGKKEGEGFYLHVQSVRGRLNSCIQIATHCIVTKFSGWPQIEIDLNKNKSSKNAEDLDHSVSDVERVQDICVSALRSCIVEINMDEFSKLFPPVPSRMSTNYHDQDFSPTLTASNDRANTESNISSCNELNIELKNVKNVNALVSGLTKVTVENNNVAPRNTEKCHANKFLSNNYKPNEIKVTKVKQANSLVPPEFAINEIKSVNNDSIGDISSISKASFNGDTKKRSRDPKRKRRNLISTLKKRMSISSLVDDRSALRDGGRFLDTNDVNNRSISVSRITTRDDKIKSNYSRTASSMSNISVISQNSNLTYVSEKSILVIELIENHKIRHYVIPYEIAISGNLPKKGKKLHIYMDHIFVAKHIKGGTFCQVCKFLIPLRIGKQAYVCRDCDLTCHKKCHILVEDFCMETTVSQLDIASNESGTCRRHGGRGSRLPRLRRH